MIVNLSSLKIIRNNCKKVVLAVGTFDLFHYEHLRYLQAAKDLGGTLVVAVKDNKCAKLKSPNRPVIDESQRMEIVDNIKCVDYTVLLNYDEEFNSDIEYDDQNQQDWLRIFEKVFRELKPDILYYEIKPELQSVRERIFKKYNVEGISRERTAIVSTTKIVNKIIEDNKKE